MKGGHGNAALKKLYATEEGIPLRTAQDRAKKEHPSWVAFLARTAGTAMTAKEPTVPQALALVSHMQTVDERRKVEDPAFSVAPPAMAKPDHLRTPEEYAECEAWKSFVLANEGRDKAMADGNAMNAVGFVGIASNALKAYHVARQARVKAELESGRLKPMAAWESTKAALVKIAGLVRGVTQVAGHANPENPHVAIKALSEWLQMTFGAEVEKELENLEREIVA